MLTLSQVFKNEQEPSGKTECGNKGLTLPSVLEANGNSEDLRRACKALTSMSAASRPLPTSLKAKSRMLSFFGEINAFRWFLTYDGWFDL